MISRKTFLLGGGAGVYTPKRTRGLSPALLCSQEEEEERLCCGDVPEWASYKNIHVWLKPKTNKFLQAH